MDEIVNWLRSHWNDVLTLLTFILLLCQFIFSIIKYIKEKKKDVVVQIRNSRIKIGGKWDMDGQVAITNRSSVPVYLNYIMIHLSRSQIADKSDRLHGGGDQNIKLEHGDTHRVPINWSEFQDEFRDGTSFFCQAFVRDSFDNRYISKQVLVKGRKM